MKIKKLIIAMISIVVIICLSYIIKIKQFPSKTTQETIPAITTEVEIESSDGKKLPVYKSKEY